MKMKVGIPSLVLCCSLFATAQVEATQQDEGIRFQRGSSWAQVQAKAKAERKIIFMEVYSTWAARCQSMRKEIFARAEVGQYINSRFVSIAVQLNRTDKDSDDVKKWYDDAAAIVKKYHVVGTCTHLFLAPDGRLVSHERGIVTEPGDFVAMASNALRYVASRADYEKGKRNRATMVWLAHSARSVGDDAFAAEVAAEYLSRLSKKDLLREENVEFAREFSDLALGARNALADPRLQDRDFYPTRYDLRPIIQIETPETHLGEALKGLMRSKYDKSSGESSWEAPVSPAVMEHVKQIFRAHLSEPAYELRPDIPKIFPAYTVATLIEVPHPGGDTATSAMIRRPKPTPGQAWVSAPDNRRGTKIEVHITAWNIPRLIAYFSPGQNVDDLKKRVYAAILTKLHMESDGLSAEALEKKVDTLDARELKDLFIDIDPFLPDFPRLYLDKYNGNSPHAQDGIGLPGLNCHATTQQFFKGPYSVDWGFPEELTSTLKRERPKDDQAKPLSDLSIASRVLTSDNFLMAMIAEQYCEVKVESVERTSFQFGDIVYDPRSHSARVLFKDYQNTLWVFDKPSMSDEPWTIRPFTESYWPSAYRDYGIEKTQFFRRCNRNKQVSIPATDIH